MSITPTWDEYQFSPKDRILFIGDSITDAGRLDCLPPFGDGFVFMVVNCLRALHPHLNLEFLNRGISGNTIEDLQKRWRRDVIRNRPDWLFIKIGINDVFQNFQLSDNPEEAVQRFSRIYHELIQSCRIDQFPKVVLLTPFYAENRPDDPILKLAEKYIDCVKAVGRRFQLPFIDLHEKFQEGLKSQPSEYWTTDKVHPHSHCHALIAITVMKYFGLTI